MTDKAAASNEALLSLKIFRFRKKRDWKRREIESWEKFGEKINIIQIQTDQRGEDFLRNKGFVAPKRHSKNDLKT